MSEAVGTIVIVALVALALAGAVLAMQPRRRIGGLLLVAAAVIALPAFILSQFAANYTE